MRVALAAFDEGSRARIEAALRGAGHTVLAAGDAGAEVEVADGVTGAAAGELAGRARADGRRAFIAGLVDVPGGVARAVAGGATEVYPAGDAAALLTRLAVIEAAGPRAPGLGDAAEAANDALYVIGFDGRFTWANAAAERLTGFPRERLIGMHVSELVRDPADLARVDEELRAKVEGRAETSFFEVRVTTAGGDTVPVEVNSRVVMREGRPWAVEGVARDVRPRKRLEEQLRREAELFAGLGVAAVAIDCSARIVSWNRAAEELFGVPAASALGTSSIDLLALPQRGEGPGLLSRVLAGERLRFEAELVRADGTTFPALVSGAPLYDEAGSVAGAVAVVVDLTAERERQRRVEQLAAVVDSSDDAVTTYDPDGRITGWNAAAERIYGMRAAEVLGRYAWELAPPGERVERRAFVERVLRGESVSGRVVRREGGPGRTGWLSLSAFPLRDGEGRVTGAAAVARDVTALIEAEREVSWLASIVGSADDAIIGRDTEGRIVSWNAAAERLFGYTAAEMVGSLGEETVPAERLEAYRARLDELGGDERVEAEVLRRSRDGRVFPVRAISFPVYSRDGRRLGSASFLRDISAEREVKAALEERERQLRALFESAGEAIVIVDLARRVRWLNQYAAEVAEQVFGTRPAAGEGILGWVREKDRLAWEIAFEAAAGGETTTLLGRLQRLDGSRFWYEMTFRPVRGEAGEVEAVALAGRDVTARVEAERALREREATLRSVFESTRDHLWLLDRGGRLVTCNTAAAVYCEGRFGRRPAPGDAMRDFADPDAQQLLEEVVERALGGEAVSGELAVPNEDGSRTYFDIQVTPVRDERGVVTGVLAAARDVSEAARSRRELLQAREALAAEYARLSTIIENSDEGIVLLDRECRVAAFNSEFAEGTRARRGVAVAPGMHFRELVSPESAEYLLGRVQEALAGRRVAFDVQSQSPGERRWFEVRIRPVVTEGGEVTGVVYTGRDVTERRKLELEREGALAEARRLAAVIESSTEAVVGIGRDGRIESWNRAAEELYGWTAAEAVGQPFRLVLPAEEAERGAALFARLLAGASYRGEMQRLTKSGRVILVESAYFPLRGPDGTVVGVGCTSHDVTREREMERRIAESAADLSATLGAIHEGVALIRADGVILAANPATQELVASLFGTVPEAGMHWREVLPPGWHERFGEVVANTLAGESSNFEQAVADREGVERWLELSFGRVTLPDGTVRGVALSMREVTERKRTEERLLQAQKAESLAVMAGGIAHDFNNLLVGILGNAGLALAELPPESPVRPIVEDIELAGQRAAELARQMLAYSGRGRFAVQPLSLNGLVEEMGHLLRSSIGAGVRLVMDLEPGAPAVVGDATQLRQVLMNLVINASDAIGAGEGTVRIRTRTEPGSEELFAKAVVAPPEPARRYVVLEVADTGAGMDAATLARIFDPFFTTKFTGRGLGLAAVLGIVRGHRGGIAVESTPGEGTRFRVMLPASDDGATTAEQAPRGERWQGSGTVLIADDEPSVRAVTARALRAMGFEVLEAADGQAAVELYAAHRERVVLVLLDMTMPKLNGEGAFRAIREMEPGAKVVLMSGYTEQDAAEKFDGTLSGFLQKPYELGQLQEMVRRVLEGGAP
ncbi:MAG: hypothetical protein KatS3mg062_1057 [Tepidiforma sp.]|nr:MAG: hypothetical protein KatS3mg062_1057 [Tepidiforma sp.]